MSQKKSKCFEELRASLGEPISRSNLDQYSGIGALHLLEGDERIEAEDLLIAKLAQNDGRAADALAEIGAKRAIPALRDRLQPSVPGIMRLAATRALQRLGDGDGLTAARDVLASGDPYDRMAAVNVIAGGGDPEAKQLLASAFSDADPSVRSAAAQRLIELHGLGAYNQSYQDRLGLLQNRLSSPLRSVRHDAISELDEIFTRSAAGESPEALGLTWRADETREPLRSFAESLRSNAPPWQQDFALDGIASLSGYDRRWVEDCLWHFLPNDPRAARALASLGVERAVEPLREALPLASGATAIEIQAALSKAIELVRAAGIADLGDALEQQRHAHQAILAQVAREQPEDEDAGDEDAE